jgi:hypothetical protein
MISKPLAAPKRAGFMGTLVRASGSSIYKMGGPTAGRERLSCWMTLTPPKIIKELLFLVNQALLI